MQEFIDTSGGQIYAFEDDVIVVVEDGIHSFYAASGMKLNIPETLIPYTAPVITPEEAAEIERNALWKAFQQTALTALGVTDAVALRCFKGGVAFPKDWNDYTWELRKIVDAESGDGSQSLPGQPAYPANT